MIDNYTQIMAQWANPTTVGMMEISPEMEMRKWAVQRTVTVLANADYYYTKREVDDLIEEITSGSVTPQEVEEMINQAIASKANQADLDALAAQVSAQAEEILNRYTKQETNALLENYLDKLKANEMFANYTKVDGSTLVLNAENITI